MSDKIMFADEDIIAYCFFCKGTPEVKSTAIGYVAYWVRCTSCGYDGPAHFVRHVAVVSWNEKAKQANEKLSYTAPPKT